MDIFINFIKGGYGKKALIFAWLRLEINQCGLDRFESVEYVIYSINKYVSCINGLAWAVEAEDIISKQDKLSLWNADDL